MCSCEQEASPCRVFPGAAASWWGRRRPNTCCLSALAAAGPTRLLTAQNVWRNPKNALHTVGHGLQRPEKVNNHTISVSGFIFFPYSGPNFTFPRASHHYFLLSPLVFHPNFTCIFFSHSATRITIRNLLIWGYKNCITVQTGFATKNECCLLRV